jgi:predicted DNA repair protein MutK
MDWVQTLTIIGSMLGATYAFYHITEKRIDKFEENMNKMDQHHREGMKEMDSKWDQAIQRMDAKWERLFERLLIQDQQKGR